MPKKAIFSAMLLGAIALLGVGCLNKDAQPPLPSITVSAQSIGANNEVTINKASIDKDGWIVIHEKQNGQPGNIIGYAALPQGKSKNIKITLDKANLSPSVIAMLHYDQGLKGVFEVPGADGPVIRDLNVIMTEFNITNYAEASK